MAGLIARDIHATLPIGVTVTRRIFRSANLCRLQNLANQVKRC
jgi:hypothetical protein